MYLKDQFIDDWLEKTLTVVVKVLFMIIMEFVCLAFNPDNMQAKVYCCSGICWRKEHRSYNSSYEKEISRKRTVHYTSICWTSFQELPMYLDLFWIQGPIWLVASFYMPDNSKCHIILLIHILIFTLSRMVTDFGLFINTKMCIERMPIIGVKGII